MQKSYMQNSNNSEIRISFATYLLVTSTLLISCILTGAVCLETGNEITGLVLMLIGVLALAIFNASTRIHGRE
jgi:hypothetical protein